VIRATNTGITGLLIEKEKWWAQAPQLKGRTLTADAKASAAYPLCFMGIGLLFTAVTCVAFHI